MNPSRSSRRSGLPGTVRPVRLGTCIAIALALAASSAAAQDLWVSPTASVGLVILDTTPGASVSAGARLSMGILTVTGVLDLSLVGMERQGDRYEWWFFSCRDSSTGQDVSWARCPDPEVRPGLMLDAAVVPQVDGKLRPLIGVGYRVGTVDTPFGLVGLTGSFGAGDRWYARFLFGGRRFLQLHFGVALR